jgi:O-antigen/teichoic acid export membrane protein
MLLISSGFLGGGTSQKVFYAMNRQGLAFRIVFSAAVVNVILSLLLIKNYGVMGAVFATGIAMIYWRISELAYIIKIIKVEFPLQFLMKVILTVSVSALLSSVIKVESILSLFISGSVFFILFLCLNYMFKPFEAFDRFGPNAVNSRFLKLVSCFCKD